ncbi:sulfite exporter TauE/SafE family protein [Limnochorda pilosa]|uniref:Probable membrane transporter protein n=1 Tax=Limnochorda pilosa TaxID=1555112 RepID=A0A0K2SKB0_LIMPI|nr:sulfite exporter TauE/SafE family protein [Limnochorda pilosa]BAS27269.1 permease [Limnochorda pilosa]
MPKGVVSAGVGAVVGLLNGLLAAGSTLLVPALVDVLRLDQRTAHGTSLLVILVTSSISLFFYQLGASVPLAAAWPLAAGSAAGGVVGAWLTPRIPPRTLRRLFAAVVLVAGYRMVTG